MRLTIPENMFSTNPDRGLRQKVLKKIIEFLKLPVTVLVKLRNLRSNSSRRVFGSTISDLAKV